MPSCAPLPDGSVSRHDASDAAIVLHQCRHGSMASASAISVGRSALLRCFAVSVINKVASSIEQHPCNCSCVSPANPVAEPLGVSEVLAYFSWSNSNRCGGPNLLTSSGIVGQSGGSTLGVPELVQGGCSACCSGSETTKPAWHLTLLLGEQTSPLGDLEGPTLLLVTICWACSAILWRCVLPPPKATPTPVSGRGPFFFPTPLSLDHVVGSATKSFWK